MNIVCDWSTECDMSCVKKDSCRLVSVWYQIIRHRISVVHVCVYELLVVLSIDCSDCVSIRLEQRLWCSEMLWE